MSFIIIIVSYYSHLLIITFMLINIKLLVYHFSQLLFIIIS